MKRRGFQSRVAVITSGGKDGCFACYQAMQDGHKVEYLFNLGSRGSNLVGFHNVPKDMVKMQSKAIGVPLFQRDINAQKKDRALFEKELKKITLELVDKGINGLVFGYVLEDYNRILAKNLCSALKLKLIEPLYKKDSRSVIMEFINLGFKAVIINVNLAFIDSYWVGRMVDEDFIGYLHKKGGIDLCGDRGEYHTFVLGGPMFGKTIDIQETSKYNMDNRCFLDIRRYRLVDKGTGRK